MLPKLEDLLRSLLNVLRSVKKEIESVGEHRQAKGGQGEAPAPIEVQVHSELGLPVTVREYYEARRSEQKSNWRHYKTGLETAAVAVGLFVACLACSTLNQVKRQSDLARDELILSHPGRFRLFGLRIWLHGSDSRQPNDEPVEFKPGMSLDGEVLIINIGNEDITLENEDRGCIAYWHTGPLPLLRPWQQIPTYTPDYCREIAPIHPSFPDGRPAGSGYLSSPGDVSVWPFSDVKVPTSYNRDMSLYIMGFFRYHGRLSRHSFILFARRYDPSKHRFFPVDDPEYEWPKDN